MKGPEICAKQVSGPFCTFLSKIKRTNNEIAPLLELLFQDMILKTNQQETDWSSRKRGNYNEAET